jgi:hypothetical protein
MKNAIAMCRMVIIGGIVLISQLAAAGPGLDVSTGGLGDGKFGMDIDAVERAIGRGLVLNKGNSKAKVRKMECSYATLSDLPGVSLRFEKAHFMAVYVSTPAVATRSGIKVGDLERTVIEKLKTDPTYHRGSNHYEESIKEITVGKTAVVGQGDKRKVLGNIIKFTSKKGRITEIQAGEAAWVGLFEQEEVCDE